MSVSLSEHLPLLAGAPDGIKKLRELILGLAVAGKLTGSDTSVWTQATLGAVGEWGSGGTPLKAHGDFYGGNIPWLVIGDLNDGVVKSAETHITDKGLANSSAKLVPFGTLLIAMYGSIGKLGIAGIECATNQAIAHCKVNSAMAECRYLFYFVRAIRGHLLSSGQGLAQQNISQKILKAIPLQLPPLGEQHRIVAKVDELMALCDRMETKQADAEAAHATLVQTLLGTLTQSRDAAELATNWQRLSQHFDTLFTTEASLNALKQTILQLAVMGKLVPQDPTDEPASELLKRIAAEKARLVAEGKVRKDRLLPLVGDEEKPFDLPVGWEWRRLEDILQISGGLTLGRKLHGRKLVSMPYLRVANVQRGYLVLDVIKNIDVPTDEVGKYELKPDDLLITEGGDWDKVGRTAIWKGEIAQCLNQNHVFRARKLVSNWNVQWTEIYLNSAIARDYFAGASKQTTNLASINMTQLRGCQFPVPPLAEQHRIVAKVDELMALCDSLKADLAESRSRQARLATTLIESALRAA